MRTKTINISKLPTQFPKSDMIKEAIYEKMNFFIEAGIILGARIALFCRPGKGQVHKPHRKTFMSFISSWFPKICPVYVICYIVGLKSIALI